MELPSNTILQNGKYKIVEKIGQGGFGIAYRAYHQGLQTEVCIKEFFYSDLCERNNDSSNISIISTSSEKIKLVDSLQKKFTKEAQRLARLKHPNIVQVTDNFEENNTAYFVMEFLGGGSLDDLIKREGIMSEQKAKALILPIIDAMDVVHKMDLLHLDIKPANIMLRKNQSPVLIDFGISKYLETANGNTTNSPIGISKGYTPLEQYGGNISDFSKATDVYSLCATIYIMVTGFAPPEPLQMLTNGFKSPRDLRPQLTENFNVAILKGLATKAVDRQQSMNQLKAAFEESKKAAETVVETEIEPEEDTLTVLNNTNKANELESEKSYNQIKSIFPSPKVIISVLIIALLNIFILTNSDIELINNTLHFYIWKLFHFQMYYNKQFTMLIGVRNLNSIVLFFGIVFQWLLTLTLVFNIKSTWKVIYDDKMTKLFRFFAKANIFFTLILSIALFVSLSTSSILGTTKYYMGSTLVYIGSVNVGIIGTLSLVCMLISGLAIFKLWQKR